MIELIVLGLLQGLAEWLPISSKSQVMLAAIGFLGMDPSKALSLSLFLHIGTLLAAIIYFRKELADMLKLLPALPKNLNNKKNSTLVFLIVSTIATGVMGVPLYLLFRKSFAQSSGEAAIAVIGLGLIVTGILFVYSGKKAGLRKEGEMNYRDAGLAGIAQALSVLPGVSRSGITTAALLFSGFSQETAIKLSFMMSIPAVIGAEIGFTLLEGLPAITIEQAVVLTLSSFVFGLVSMDLLVRLARTINFGLFCIVLGIISLIPWIAIFFHLV